MSRYFAAKILSEHSKTVAKEPALIEMMKRKNCCGRKIIFSTTSNEKSSRMLDFGTELPLPVLPHVLNRKFILDILSGVKVLDPKSIG